MNKIINGLLLILVVQITHILSMETSEHIMSCYVLIEPIIQKIKSSSSTQKRKSVCPVSIDDEINTSVPKHHTTPSNNPYTNSNMVHDVSAPSVIYNRSYCIRDVSDSDECTSDIDEDEFEKRQQKGPINNASQDHNLSAFSDVKNLMEEEERRIYTNSMLNTFQPIMDIALTALNIKGSIEKRTLEIEKNNRMKNFLRNQYYKKHKTLTNKLVKDSTNETRKKQVNSHKVLILEEYTHKADKIDQYNTTIKEMIAEKKQDIQQYKQISGKFYNIADSAISHHTNDTTEEINNASGELKNLNNTIKKRKYEKYIAQQKANLEKNNHKNKEPRFY
ncbi:MAG TPA: hypothetical protein VLB80_04290 [Candidatus Babeliales bacterium]|nr:hypothetical protein [Candidatus Babeliales bacterium]